MSGRHHMAGEGRGPLLRTGSVAMELAAAERDRLTTLLAMQASA